MDYADLDKHRVISVVSVAKLLVSVFSRCKYYIGAITKLASAHTCRDSTPAVFRELRLHSGHTQAGAWLARSAHHATL